MSTPNNQIEAEPAPAPAPAPASASAPERMVSVNDIGGPRSGIAAKLALAILVCCIAAVGVLMAANRYRAHASAEAQAATPPRTAQASAAAAPRRIFGSTPPVSSAASLPAPPPLVGRSCRDGLPGDVLKDPAGVAVLTPTGQPVRVCSNGQLLLPPLSVDGAAGAGQEMRPGGGAPTGASTGTTPVATPPPAAGTAAPATPAASPYDGALFVPQPQQPVPPGAGPGETPAAPDGATPAAVEALAPRGGAQARARAHAAGAVQAHLLGNRDMLLPQGRSIDCNLSLRLVSTLSGMAVCVLSSYVYGDSGVVALAEPGSVATGEYVAIGAQGQRRLVIVWNRLETTQGVVIELNSPAADALGTAGLDGYIDNRWPERIGAAMLLSVVQDAIAYETARASSNGNGAGGVAVFQQSSQTGERLAERILDSTINIKPTLYKQQGDRASITVAHDLDFGSVYVLRAK